MHNGNPSASSPWYPPPGPPQSQGPVSSKPVPNAQSQPHWQPQQNYTNGGNPGPPNAPTAHLNGFPPPQQLPAPPQLPSPPQLPHAPAIQQPTQSYNPPVGPPAPGPPIPPPQPISHQINQQQMPRYPPMPAPGPPMSRAQGPQPSWMPPPGNCMPPGPPVPPQSMGGMPPEINGPQPPMEMRPHPDAGRRPELPPGSQHQQNVVDDMQRMRLQAQEGRPIDLMQDRHLLPPQGIKPMFVKPPHNVENPHINCDPDIFRSSLGCIPQTNDLLKKSKLPLGLYLHPFKDMKSLNILQVSHIVRCRSCRTYINPFVQFTDARHWRCNVCCRTNDLPDDFSWDPVTKSYGDPQRRPEIRHSTIEFIAPSEYMPIRKDLDGFNELRPPQPAVYVFVLDISASAVESGYIGVFSDKLAQCLSRLPGDKRLQVAFIGVDSCVHFFRFVPGFVQPQQLVVKDIDDIFLPSCSGLLVNLEENNEVVTDFVNNLPTIFAHNSDIHSALGAAVTAAHRLIADMGGRVCVMQTCLPDLGPGALKSREDPNMRASDQVTNLNPATDFYKLLALECNGHQVAIDLFLMSSKYADLATLSGMSRHCAGSVHYFPGLHILRNRIEMDRFTQIMQRYLTRKIGFESVLRIRCTKGIALHTFFGNFFVRSTDLLAMPNINPDTALGAQVHIEESLETNQAVFQAALLYTSSKGDRRIRVHTLCLPVVRTVAEVHASADVEAIVSMLAKLAAERSQVAALSDAREALVNSVIDALAGFKQSMAGAQRGSVMAPNNMMKLMPMLVLGLLKHPAFSFGTSIKLDRRFYEMCQFKTNPLNVIMLEIYPALYDVHYLDQLADSTVPDRMQLSYEYVREDAVYLLDCGSTIYIYIGKGISENICSQLFDVQSPRQIDDDDSLPELETALSKSVNNFILDLQNKRPFHAPVQLIRDDGPKRAIFAGRLVEDKQESSHSYIEFIQHLRSELTK